MKLVKGRFYQLDGMTKDMWDVGHGRYGMPRKLVGRYLITGVGERRWHIFEIWIGGREEGAIMMNDDDLKKIRITPVLVQV